jgi:hypothetical protein
MMHTIVQVQPSITSPVTRAAATTTTTTTGSSAPSSSSVTSSLSYRATEAEQLRGAMAARRARLREDGLTRSELLEVRSTDTNNDDNDDLIPDDNDDTDDDNDDSQPGREPGSLSYHDDTQPGATLTSKTLPLPLLSSSTTTIPSTTIKGEGKQEASSVPVAAEPTTGLRQRPTASTSVSSKPNGGNNDERAQLLTKTRGTAAAAIADGVKAYVKEGNSYSLINLRLLTD